MIHLINLQDVNFDGVENIAAFRGEVDINGNFCYVKVVSTFVPVHSPDYTYIFQNKLNAMTTEHKHLAVTTKTYTKLGHQSVNREL